MVPRRLLTLLALALLSTGLTATEPADGPPVPWTPAAERAQIARREDPGTWSQELFARDLDRDASDRPMSYGVFPVPSYDLLGKRSFRGLGNRLTVTEWKGRHLVGMVYFANRNPWNEAELGEASDRVFVHVLVLREEPLQHDPPNLGAQVVSRNHPHAVAQGWFGTKSGDIEYVAFQAATGDAWALVNLRLFDLTAGRCLLIVPQPDGTLRSKQLDAPPMSALEAQAYHESLLRDPEIVKFLESKAAPAGE